MFSQLRKHEVCLGLLSEIQTAKVKASDQRATFTFPIVELVLLSCNSSSDLNDLNRAQRRNVWTQLRYPASLAIERLEPLERLKLTLFSRVDTKPPIQIFSATNGMQR
jgi:hypothetical protein